MSRPLESFVEVQRGTRQAPSMFFGIKWEIVQNTGTTPDVFDFVILDPERQYLLPPSVEVLVEDLDGNVLFNGTIVSFDVTFPDNIRNLHL